MQHFSGTTPDLFKIVEELTKHDLAEVLNNFRDNLNKILDMSRQNVLSNTDLDIPFALAKSQRNMGGYGLGQSVVKAHRYHIFAYDSENMEDAAMAASTIRNCGSLSGMAPALEAMMACFANSRRGGHVIILIHVGEVPRDDLVGFYSLAEEREKARARASILSKQQAEASSTRPLPSSVRITNQGIDTTEFYWADFVMDPSIFSVADNDAFIADLSELSSHRLTASSANIAIPQLEIDTRYLEDAQCVAIVIDVSCPDLDLDKHHSVMVDLNTDLIKQHREGAFTGHEAISAVNRIVINKIDFDIPMIVDISCFKEREVTFNNKIGTYLPNMEPVDVFSIVKTKTKATPATKQEIVIDTRIQKFDISEESFLNVDREIEIVEDYRSSRWLKYKKEIAITVSDCTRHYHDAPDSVGGDTLIIRVNKIKPSIGEDVVLRVKLADILTKNEKRQVRNIVVAAQYGLKNPIVVETADLCDKVMVVDSFVYRITVDDPAFAVGTKRLEICRMHKGMQLKNSFQPHAPFTK